MNYEELAQNVAPIIEKRRKKGIWQKIVTIMACLVVFCTTYALILPAITSETEPHCTIESHTHSQECYVCVSEQAEAFSCNPESLGVHVHGTECLDEAGNTICGQVNFIAHSHDELCYDADGQLRCTLPENSAHAHDDSCYVTTEVLVHSHIDSCYESVLLCELAESEEHIHDETCYDPNPALVCGMEDGQEVIVPLAEPVLICELPTAPTHVHNEECFQVVQAEPSCGLEEGEEHTHEAMCYGVWELTCELEEHVHSPECFSDPDADVEDASQWEATFAHLTMSGNRADDLLAIARTQLGYAESTANFLVEESGVVKGYTRYGQWYGDVYGDWCAMFVSFCLHYAEVEGVPLHAACVPWIRELSEMELYRSAEEYTPYPGDIIFFDWEGDGVSDHVGLVAEFIPATDTHAARVRTIEGNSSNCVQYVTYDLDDARIAGYGMLPVTRVDTEACGLVAHAHAETCYDDLGALTCQIEEHTHSVDCVRYNVVYADSQMRVSAVIEGCYLPEDISLEVAKVQRETDTYNLMYAAIDEELTDDSHYVGGASFYQMRLASQGETCELPEGVEADVNIFFTNPVFTSEAMERATDTHTYILTPEMVSEDLFTEDKTEQSDIDDGVKIDLGEPAPGETATPLVIPAVTEVSEETEEPVETEEPEEPEETETYLLREAEVEKYKNLSRGITGLKFRSGEVKAIAMALTTQTQTGRFWTRVSTTDELAAGGTFMIVSAEGNYALAGSNSNNYTAVTVSGVKGWKQYYTISNGDDTNLHWNFSGSGTKYTAQNKGSNNYISLSLSSTIISSTKRTLTFSYQAAEKCWRIAYNSYYLRNSGTGKFSRTSSDDGSYSSSAKYYYTRDMLIFKLAEDVNSLEITDDFMENASSSGNNGQAPEKPDYGEFTTPSDSKVGDTAVVDPDDSTVSISGKYYSDPATSDIEQGFRCDTFEENQLNDGKVMTDKSVIYGADDYGAFESYDANTFGVALSALAQEYKIPYQDVVVTPIDVVFILDGSGSMTTNGTDGRDPNRAAAVTKAINAAIKQIMDDHEANRVGVAVYSSGAWEVLPLGRYTANNNEYFVCNKKTVTFTPTNYKPEVSFISGSASLKNEAGTSYANAGSNSLQGLGTYTQAGIAMGNKIFGDIGEDTTYTTVVGEGENARTYTVNRQPVFILLSDGEPTHSTNIYMDPLNGPHYGDGNGTSENAMGVHGYYTVLSANYFKRMVSIQYEKQAMFYSIGMGINSPEQGDGPMVDGSSTGDNYKRAVLNPTKENIENLTTTTNKAITTDQLKQMILGSYTSHAVQVRSNWPDSWTGVPHRYAPILQGNPYANNYSYADDAYFGTMSSDELEEVFGDIVSSSIKSTPYGFILHQNSAVELVDNIGKGMEVKGTPILRYNGVNYANPIVRVNGNVTTYVYQETYVDPHIPNRSVDLSEITITLTTDADGNQTVKMFVPDNLLPTYTPELIGQTYYYEALPVRLIYQVGLTEESVQDVLDIQKTGGELTFYANRWEEESDIATSTLTPSIVNPYYYDVNHDGTEPNYHPHETVKSENASGSYDYVVKCTPTTDENDDSVLKIVHKIGNNGKLVFAADTVNIAVEKAWDGVNASVMNPIDITLYKVKETITDDGATRADAEAVQTVTVSANENWKAVFENVPIPEDPWYYAVAENVPAGYQVTYSAQTVMISVENGAPFMAAKVDMTDLTALRVTMTNSPAVELPATGGVGTQMYTTGGLLLMIAAASFLLYRHTKRRRKEDLVSS